MERKPNWYLQLIKSKIRKHLIAAQCERYARNLNYICTFAHVAYCHNFKFKYVKH